MTKVALLLMALIWSGVLSFRVLFHIRDALALGRIGRHQRGSSQPRVILARREPGEFWAIILAWVVSLGAFGWLFAFSARTLFYLMFEQPR
jgi:hypothetical protein